MMMVSCRERGGEDLRMRTVRVENNSHKVGRRCRPHHREEHASYSVSADGRKVPKRRDTMEVQRTWRRKGTMENSNTSNMSSGHQSEWCDRYGSNIGPAARPVPYLIMNWKSCVMYKWQNTFSYR